MFAFFMFGAFSLDLTFYKTVTYMVLFDIQTWNNAQARKQCLCKFSIFGVKFQNVPAFTLKMFKKGCVKQILQILIV